MHGTDPRGDAKLAGQNRKAERRLPKTEILSESVDESSEAVPVTAWDMTEDAEAHEQSGPYADLITKLGEWFTAPELRTYEVPERSRVVGAARTPKLEA